MRQVIKPRDQVFATGVFLQRTEDNRWIVASFEDDTYFDGKIVNQVESDTPYTGDDEEEQPKQKITMKKKYIFVSLKIKSGEYEFNSQSVHEVSTKKHTNSFGNNYARTFYSDLAAKEGDWFYFNCGEVAVKCTASEEITKNEYDVLNKFQYK